MKNSTTWSCGKLVISCGKTFESLRDISNLEQL